jgi:hypothetical protein
MRRCCKRYGPVPRLAQSSERAERGNVHVGREEMGPVGMEGMVLLLVTGIIEHVAGNRL